MSKRNGTIVFRHALAITLIALAGFSAKAEQASGMAVTVELPESATQSEGKLKFWIEGEGKRRRLKAVSSDDGSATLLINGRVPVGRYSLYCQASGEKRSELEPLDQCFEILGPTISNVEYDDFSKGAKATLTGMFFGSSPKVTILYQLDDGCKRRRKRCRVDKKSLPYQRLGAGASGSAMDPETGISQVTVTLPNLRTNSPVDVAFLIESDDGEGIYFVNQDKRAANDRGTLISYNYRGAVAASGTWDYLLHSLGDNWFSRALANLLCKSTKLREQTYKFDLKLYTVVYWTIDGSGQPIPASGVVCVPDGVSSAPTLSLQHGTMLMKSEAPSVSDGGEMAFGVTYAASEGFLTSIPDHAGLGVAALPIADLYHPYCQWEPIADSDADMLVALRTFLSKAIERGDLETKITQDGRLFLCGYSEGGYATLGLQRELEANPDLYDAGEIVANGAMAGPYSLSGVMLDRLMADEKFRVPYFAPYLLVTMSDDYNLYQSASDYMASPYDQTVAPLIDGYHSSSAVNDAMPSLVRQCLLPSIQTELDNDTGPFFEGLRKNDLVDLPAPGWSPVATVMLVHGKTDDCVLWQNSEDALEYFQNDMGKTNISLRTLKSNALIDIASLAEPTHVLYAPYAFGETWTWFHDLVADSNAELPPTGEVETEGDAEEYENLVHENGGALVDR